MKKISILILLYSVFTIYPQVPYGKYFKRYSNEYFGKKFDHYWFVAQAKQESRFDSLAVSPVGATGLLQIMPNTWNDLTGGKVSIYSAKYNIKYGIKYDKWLWDNWTSQRPFIDRISFMLGSYNAGLGNPLKAQKIAKERGLNENLWSSIEKTLPEVTGKHSKETITYVKRIKKYYNEYRKQ